MRIALRKTFDFEAAHWLPTFPDGHKCRRLHGHSFKIDVVVEGEVDEAKGYLQDFGDIKAAIAPIQLRLDHYLLNEIEGLSNPTAELLAKHLPDLTKENRALAVAALVRSPDRAKLLVDELAAGRAKAEWLDEPARKVLLGHPDADVRSRAERVLKR